METDAAGRRSTLPLDDPAHETVRYRRNVQIPADWAGKSIHLILDGSSREPAVLVDETPVAFHGDHSTTIEVDLTEALHGRTAFVLGVDARISEERSQSPAPDPDQSEVAGEVWKRARLEARNPIHIAKLSVGPSLDVKTGVVSVNGEISRAAPLTTLQATLSRGGEMAARLIYHFRKERFEGVLALPDAEISVPEAPKPYDLVIELLIGDAAVDRIESVVQFDDSPPGTASAL